VLGARFVAWSPPRCAGQRAGVAAVDSGADAGTALAVGEDWDGAVGVPVCNPTVGVGLAESVGRGDVCAWIVGLGRGEDVA
jgi:hypothetical protein